MRVSFILRSLWFRSALVLSSAGFFTFHIISCVLIEPGIGDTTVRPPGRVVPQFLLGQAPAGTVMRSSLAPSADSAPANRSPVEMLNDEFIKLMPKMGTPANRAIFSSYQSNGKSQWANNWMKHINFTGVAWDHKKAGVLISDRHVIMSAHYIRPVGSTLTFHDRAGNPVKRKLAAFRNTRRTFKSFPDIAVGRLDRPVPRSITYYPVLPGGDYSSLLNGARVIVTNQHREVLIFKIRDVLNRPDLEYARLQIGLKQDIDFSWSEKLITGDSGHPTFLYYNGQLILIATHTSGGWGPEGPFYGGTFNQRYILQAAAALDKQVDG